MTVTYATFVKQMLEEFPFLRADCLTYMDEDDPLPYVALGAVLIPCLERWLAARDESNVAKACEFLEATAAEGRRVSDKPVTRALTRGEQGTLESKVDSRLDDLMGVEIGEWLSGVKERKLLLSHFGPDTQRVCQYHISRLSDQG